MTLAEARGAEPALAADTLLICDPQGPVAIGGVTLLIGTDSGIPMKFHSGSTWHELDAWVNKLGVDPMMAIRAATYWPAVMMKVDKDYGSISEGKGATFCVNNRLIAVLDDAPRCLMPPFP